MKLDREFIFSNETHITNIRYNQNSKLNPLAEQSVYPGILLNIL